MAVSGDPRHGRFGRIEVSEDGINYFKVGGLLDQTEDANQEEVDKTSKDSEGRRQFVLGYTDTAWTFSCRTMQKDEGQRILRDSVKLKKCFTLRYYDTFDPGSGLPFTEGSNAFATSMSRTSPAEDINGTDFTVRPGDITTKFQ